MDTVTGVKKMKFPFQFTRKYSLALLSLVGSFVALSHHWIDGGQWVAVVTLILTVHGTANIVDKKFVPGGAG